MTKSIAPNWRLTRLLMIWVFAGFPIMSFADAWRLPELMQLLSSQKSGKAQFVEKKFIGIIDKPIVSSGEISFNAPDLLEKRTIKPRPELMRLEGDKLTVTQFEKRPLQINLQEHPEVAGIVGSIRGTLLGDQAALEKSFQIQLSGTTERWQLVLTPRQASVAKSIRRITIRGVDAALISIDFDHADGDRSEMQISNLLAP